LKICGASLNGDFHGLFLTTSTAALTPN